MTAAAAAAAAVSLSLHQTPKLFLTYRVAWTTLCQWLHAV